MSASVVVGVSTNKVVGSVLSVTTSVVEFPSEVQLSSSIVHGVTVVPVSVVAVVLSSVSVPFMPSLVIFVSNVLLSSTLLFCIEVAGFEDCVDAMVTSVVSVEFFCGCDIRY